MHRYVLGLAVGAVVLAVGVVGAVVIMRGGGPTQTSEVTAPGDTSGVAAVAESAAPATNAVAEPRRERRPSRRIEEDAPPQADAGNSAAAASNDENPAPSADVKARMAALLQTLTEEERNELGGQMMRQRMDQFREQARYRMPSDGRLRGLERNRNEALRLSDAQQTQLSAFREAMKPKIDAALSPYWKQEEDMRQAIDAGTATRDDLRAVYQEMNKVRDTLDAEYMSMVQTVLTPEQSAELANEQNSNNNDGGRGGRRGGFPGGGFSGPGGGGAGAGAGR